MKFSRRFWLVLILLFAFAYRLYRLGAASLWYDETVSIYLARLDLISLTRHTAGDIHPPFYYYLLHFWIQLAGASEFSAAFLSVIFGMLLVALVYRVARDWFDRIPPSSLNKGGVSLIAAVLVAISPYNLWYSQEVRMYTLGAFLGLASVYFGWRTLSRQSLVASRQIFFSRDFIAYAIVSTLGIYTLYYFVFLLLFENLAALVWIIRNSKIKNQKSKIFVWLASQIAILILFLPWLTTAIRQAVDPPVPPWRSFVPLPNVLLESFTALTLGQSVEWQSPSWVWGGLFIVALVFVVGLKSQDASHKFALDTWSLGLAAYTFIPLLLIAVLSFWKPLYHVRYVFTYSPAFYILLAVGIARITEYKLHIAKFLAGGISALLIVASSISARNFWFDPQYTKDDLRNAVQHITHNWRPGDAVLVNAGYTYTAFLYYFDQPIGWRGRLTEYAPRSTNSAVVLQTGSIGADKNLGWGDPESDFYATTADETRAALDRVFVAHPRVWMLRLYDTVVDPAGVVRDYLAQHGRIMDDLGVAGSSFARAQGYLTTREPLTQLPSSATRREVLLGNRILFLGFEPKEISARAGEPIDVNLYWRGKEATNVDARVYMGLFDAEGKLVASTDELPLGNGLGTSRWGSGEIMREPARLIAPKNLARGSYSLRVQMYNPLTNERLIAEKSEWVVEGTQIVLTQVSVEK